jgi:hypothetical protein
MTKEKFLEILDKHIDEKGLAKDMAILLLLPLLEKFVKETDNPYDDKLIEWFKPWIEKNI